EDHLRRGHRIAGRAHEKTAGEALRLCERHVDLRDRLLLEPELLHVGYDADDGSPRLTIVERHARADRLLLVPVLRHRPIDDRDERRLSAVAIAERAACDDRHAERLKIVWCDHANIGGWPLLRIV